MSTQAKRQHQYTFDLENQLQDRVVVSGAVASFAGTVDGQPVVLDFGGTDISGIERVAYTSGRFVVEVEDAQAGIFSVVQVVWQLSQDPNFGPLSIIQHQSLGFGVDSGAFGSADDLLGNVGQLEMRVDNEWMGERFRYARAFFYHIFVINNAYTVRHIFFVPEITK